jgi:hypothetical protein
VSKKVTSDKKKEKLSLNGPAWPVTRETCRRRIASLVTVLKLVTCHLSLVTVFALAQSQTTGRISGTVKSLATAEERKVTTDEV